MTVSTILYASTAYARVKPASSPRWTSTWAVIFLLTALFAGAILAALQPRPLIDARQAAIEGGL